MSLSIGVLTVPGEDVGTVVSVPAPEVMPGCWLCLLWLCTSTPASLTAHCPSSTSLPITSTGTGTTYNLEF